MELGAGFFWINPGPQGCNYALKTLKNLGISCAQQWMQAHASAILTTQCSQTLNRGSRGEATALWAFKLFWDGFHCCHATQCGRWSLASLPHLTMEPCVATKCHWIEPKGVCSRLIPIIILSKTCSFGMVYLTWHIEVENDCLRNDFPSDFRVVSLSLAPYFPNLE